MKSRLLFLPCSAAALLAVYGYSLERDRPGAGADGSWRLFPTGDGQRRWKNDRLFRELLEAFVHQVIRETPEALILSGSLTFNGEAASHRHLAAALRRVEEASVRIFVLPGNYDLEIPWRRSSSARADGLQRASQLRSSQSSTRTSAMEKPWPGMTHP